MCQSQNLELKTVAVSDVLYFYLKDLFSFGTFFNLG